MFDEEKAENAMLEGLEDDIEDAITTEGDAEPNPGGGDKDDGDPGEADGFDDTPEVTDEGKEKPPPKKETPPAGDDKFAGKSRDEAVQMYKDLERKLGEQSSQVGLLKSVQPLLDRMDSDEAFRDSIQNLWDGKAPGGSGAGDGDAASGDIQLLSEEDITDPQKVVAWYKGMKTSMLAEVKAEVARSLGGNGKALVPGSPANTEGQPTANDIAFDTAMTKYAQDNSISAEAMTSLEEWAGKHASWTPQALIAAYNAGHADKITVSKGNAPPPRNESWGDTSDVSRAAIREIHSNGGPPALEKWVDGLKGKDVSKAERLIVSMGL